MKMKKILILAYFFPPSNFAGSFRSYSFAKYLNKFGYYPVVVTRKSKENTSSFYDMAEEIGGDVVHEVHDGYEVYYMPYKNSNRDKLLVKYGNAKFVLFRKILTLVEQLFQYICNGVIPYRNMYAQSKKLLEASDEYSFILASGKPYILFKFAYLLSKRFKIKWIAEYRDEWNSCSNQNNVFEYQKVLLHIEKFFEKKWIKTASCIISVSDYITNSIRRYHGQKGYTILNGFDQDDYNAFEKEPLNDFFTITYNGSLYATQPIEIFIEGFIQFLKSHTFEQPPLLQFPGLLTMPETASKVTELLKGYEDYYQITGRILKKEVIRMQMRSHLLLMVGHTSVKGTYSSKIFEYLACRRPVLLCPSDGDVLVELIKNTKSGFICNTEKEVVELLERMYKDYDVNLPDYNEIEIKRYSRENQVKVLARIMEEIEVKDKR